MVQGLLSLQLRIDPTLENGSVADGTVTGEPEPEAYEFKLIAGPVPAELVQLMVTSMRTITNEFFKSPEILSGKSPPGGGGDTPTLTLDPLWQTPASNGELPQPLRAPLSWSIGLN
jgi:hypothetical protein